MSDKYDFADFAAAVCIIAVAMVVLVAMVDAWDRESTIREQKVAALRGK